MAQAETPASDQQQTDQARPWLLLGTLLLTLAAALLGSLLLPHDRYVRYQQLRETLHFRSLWAYERIVYDPTPIDIAIIGNSRLRSAISAPLLQEQLKTELGRDFRVVNISLPQEGRNAQYAIAKVLFEHHPEVKVVIMSAIEEMPRQGHPAFRNLADPMDALGAPMLINSDYAEDLAFTSFRQVSLAVQSALPGLFGIRPFDKAAYSGSDLDTTTSFLSATGNFVDKDTIWPVEEIRGPARERIRSITPPVLPEGLAAREYAIEYTYTKGIVDLARASGAKVGFLYMPVFEHAEPLAQEEFYTAIGPVLSATCIASRHEMFSDYGHMNNPGAREVTRLFGAALAKSRLMAGLTDVALGDQNGAQPARKVIEICP